MKLMWRWVIAGSVTLIVTFLLLPFSGTHGQPPTCYGIFGYGVPCDVPLAFLGGLLAGGLALALAFAWGSPDTGQDTTVDDAERSPGV